MAINLRENQYRGVNAHLHSYLQQMGEWESFHSEHITHLREALEAILPTGYRARTERSLQLSAFDPLTGDVDLIYTKPDITVFHKQTPSGQSLFAEALLSPAAAVPTDVFTLVETLTDPQYLSAIVVTKFEGDSPIGVPVTRIELLSPANKPPGSHAPQYRANRNRTLLSGIHMVEIDYLHERRFPVEPVKSYPDQQVGATAYTILVSVATEQDDKGMALHYGFGVDEAIPPIPIPLMTGAVTLELSSVYNHTFRANGFYGEDLVDYDALPLAFERYMLDDQARIQTLMKWLGEAK